MRITDIEITNYKAFYGVHHLSLDKDGKNLMVYGENGSGKSSLFSALYRFFQSSIKKVEVDENIFIPASQKDSATIKLTIKESPESSKSVVFELNAKQKEIVSADKIIITDANKIKGFFDYRSLLKTHLDHKEGVNLFNILIEDILPHAINRFTNKEIGEEWAAIVYKVFEEYQTQYNVDLAKDYIEKFNNGLTELLHSIESDTNTFMKYFGANVKVSLKYDGIVYGGKRNLGGQNIILKIHFYDKSIDRHQFFLNEARLSALAISLYLASIRVNPSHGKLKIMVLDDLLIGLDMSNRIPLLSILKDSFVNVKIDEQFQIVMTTYDKVWFDLVRNYFGDNKWKYIEIYSQHLKDEDFEIPLINDSSGFLERAKYYLSQNDYKASAVYIRTEFERLVKTMCEKKTLTVLYKKNQKELKSDDFWSSIVEQSNIDAALVKEIEIHRGTVMNPFSHYDLEKPEFKTELENTIKSIEKLKSLDLKSLQKITIEDLKKRVDVLEHILDKKDQILKIVRSKLPPKAPAA
jgi:energy-coupling factor transporter ATP-binding protein EcfA2